MLESLRKMESDAKRKLGLFFAGVMTLVIAVVWLGHESGVFSKAIESTGSQGVALFSFVEQNVENAYGVFQKGKDALTASVGGNKSVATSTEESAIVASSTTSGELEIK